MPRIIQLTPSTTAAAPALQDDDRATMATALPQLQELSPLPRLPSHLPASHPRHSSHAGDVDSIITDIHVQDKTPRNAIVHRDLPKLILSFFLSPTGYRLLRLDRRRKNRSVKRKRQDRISKQAVLDPDDYAHWFSAQAHLPLSPSIKHHPLLTPNTSTVSAATRAGVRGFALAFLACSLLEVLLPAMLKRNFRGFLHKVFTNGSAFRMGSSAGLFALLYKLLFRQLSLALCRVPTTTSTITSDNPDDSVVSGSTAVPDNESLISPTTPIPTSLHRSMRADSGIDLDQEDKILGKGGSGAYREHSTLQMASQLRLQRTWIPAMIAALLASPAFSLIPQQTRRLTISLYFLTYAGETVFSALENEGYTQWMPTWAGPWILFVAASTQLIHAYVHHTECLPETLRKVIQSQCSPYLVKPPNFDTNKWGPFPNTKDTFIGLCNYLVADRKSMPVFVSRELAAAASTASTAEVAKGMFLAPESLRSVMAATEGMGHDSAMCRVFHPTTPSCVQAGIELSGKNTAFALKLYSSFAVLTFLSRGGNVFQHGILNYFKSTAINIVRSSLYTWGFMMTAFTLFCGFERCLPRAILPSKRTYLNGFIGSLWILVESRKRQAALSMYFFRFMLESVWRRMVKSGIVQNIKHGEVLLFGTSMAMIMGFYESAPLLQRKSLVQAALTKILED